MVIIIFCGAIIITLFMNTGKGKGRLCANCQAPMQQDTIDANSFSRQHQSGIGSSSSPVSTSSTSPVSVMVVYID